MNVREAIVLMANNPDVGFPWEGTLVNLINGFLPQGDKLDPQTAEAVHIQHAIDTLDAATKEMVFASEIGNGTVRNDTPAPTPDAGSGQLAMVVTKIAVFIFAIAVLYIVAKVGEADDLIEILKLVIATFLQPAGG